MIKVERQCLACGISFMIRASAIKYNKGKVCSTKCQYELAKSRAKRVTLNCLFCKKEYLVRSYRNGNSRFCSMPCRHSYYSGPRHFRYRGGVRYLYGKEWDTQRRRAKRRDNNTCQHCGITQQESRLKLGAWLHVHHIIPLRVFSTTLEANRLDNLVVLCSPCHKKAESICIAAWNARVADMDND